MFAPKFPGYLNPLIPAELRPFSECEFPLIKMESKQFNLQEIVLENPMVIWDKPLIFIYDFNTPQEPMSNKHVSHYCQCLLETADSTPQDHTRTVTWLPFKFAKVGKTISMKDKEWRDWRVLSAGPPVEAEIVEDRERDYLKHREFSDI